LYASLMVMYEKLDEFGVSNYWFSQTSAHSILAKMKHPVLE
jgi:hypothetical protein